MKKLLLSFTLILVTIVSVDAQCVPDPQYTDPGIYPDSATGFAPGCADQAYYQLITNVVPTDTTIMIGPFPATIPFDSVVIVSWTGLPAGFTYACFDSQNTISPQDGCAYEGGTTGCAEVMGNPTMGDIGSYQQVITVDAYLGGDPNPMATEVVDYYYIQMVDCSSAGMNFITTSKFLVYPNPAKNVITLNGLNDIAVESVQVLNMDGKVMASYEGVSGPALDMNITHLSEGMYFVNVNYDGKTEVIKFIKE